MVKVAGVSKRENVFSKNTNPKTHKKHISELIKMHFGAFWRDIKYLKITNNFDNDEFEIELSL